MKVLDIARPSWGAVAVAVIAGTAIGFAAGLVVGRDPAAARRAAARATHWAASGVEQAALWAAQMREHIGDLWAEAREASLGAVDAADFARQSAATAAAAPAADPGPRPSARRGTRAASRPRAKPAAEAKARARPGTPQSAGLKATARGDKAAPAPRRRAASRRPVEPVARVEAEPVG